MPSANQQKHTDPPTISEQAYARLGVENSRLVFEVSRLEHENRMLRSALFGKRNERFVATTDGAEQVSLFDESEVGPIPAEAPKEQAASVKKKAKAQPKRKPLEVSVPESIERREEVIEPENKQDDFRKIGQEVTEILEQEPAKLWVRCIIRPKYATPGGTVVIAPMPELPLPKSNAGASILAKQSVDKFVDHLPFHRQLKILARQGVRIAESTYNGWFGQTCELLGPLYGKLSDAVLGTDYLKADESPMPVQAKDKKGATHQGYQWVVQNPANGLTLFSYNRSRSKEVPKALFYDFKNGALQTDGYSSYNEVAKINKLTQLACWAHARRKFHEALTNDKVRAEYALAQIQELYKIERRAREEGLSYGDISVLRQKESIPVLDKIKQWLDAEKDKVLPKSPIGKAISYTLNLWHRLTVYAQNGKYEIDNNSIENKIRPLALGRKNYMFAGSHEAAQRVAMMYSFFGSCAANGINPEKWMISVLERIPAHKANKLHELLPTKENFPDLAM